MKINEDKNNKNQKSIENIEFCCHQKHGKGNRQFTSLNPPTALKPANFLATCSVTPVSSEIVLLAGRVLFGKGEVVRKVTMCNVCQETFCHYIPKCFIWQTGEQVMTQRLRASEPNVMRTCSAALLASFKPSLQFLGTQVLLNGVDDTA